MPEYEFRTDSDIIAAHFATDERDTAEGDTYVIGVYPTALAFAEEVFRWRMSDEPVAKIAKASRIDGYSRNYWHAPRRKGVLYGTTADVYSYGPQDAHGYPRRAKSIPLADLMPDPGPRIGREPTPRTQAYRLPSPELARLAGYEGTDVRLVGRFAKRLGIIDAMVAAQLMAPNLRERDEPGTYEAPKFWEVLRGRTPETIYVLPLDSRKHALGIPLADLIGERGRPVELIEHLDTFMGLLTLKPLAEFANGSEQGVEQVQVVGRFGSKAEFERELHDAIAKAYPRDKPSGIKALQLTGTSVEQVERPNRVLHVVPLTESVMATPGLFFPTSASVPVPA